MKFRQFWPLYLRAHSLPGTRAMHYVATVVGVTAVVQALVSRQPLFLFGIGLAYAIAIGAHVFIERNAPLIRVNALWGAVADLRMSWLAITGALSREISRSGVQSKDGAIHPAGDLKTVAKFIRIPLLFVSAAGLAAGLLDLDDLVEAGSGLHYPFIQLGAPIAAFTAALGIGIWTMSAARSSASAAASAPAKTSMSAVEASLWRACLGLVFIGITALVAAELAEHGLSDSTQLYLAFATMIALIAALPIALLSTRRALASKESSSKPGRATTIGKWVCYMGGAILVAGGVSVLGWQAWGWVQHSAWEPVSLVVSGVILLSAGLYFSDKEKRLQSDWLFRLYLSRARSEPNAIGRDDDREPASD